MLGAGARLDTLKAARCGAERRFAPLYCTNANAAAPRCLRAASGGATAVRDEAAKRRPVGQAAEWTEHRSSGKCGVLSTLSQSRNPPQRPCWPSWGLPRPGRNVLWPLRPSPLPQQFRALSAPGWACLVLMRAACQVRVRVGKGPYRPHPMVVNICTGASKLDPNSHVCLHHTFSHAVQRCLRALAYPQGSGPGLRPGPSAAVFGASSVAARQTATLLPSLEQRDVPSRTSPPGPGLRPSPEGVSFYLTPSHSNYLLT